MIMYVLFLKADLKCLHLKIHVNYSKTVQKHKPFLLFFFIFIFPLPSFCGFTVNKTKLGQVVTFSLYNHLLLSQVGTKYMM